MSLGPYIQVNPNERPSQYLSRVRSAGSEAGTKISWKEAQEGHQLLTIWELEKFKRLTTLPTQRLARELHAIQEMSKFRTQNPTSPLSVAGVNVGNVLIAIGILGIMLGGVIKTAELKNRIGQQNQLISTLVAKIEELGAKKARGKITPDQYENEIQEIIREVVQRR